MDWSDERWVKLYTRDTTDWLALSWQAQGLFVLILRKVNRAGVIDLGRAGKRGLSAHIGGGSAWVSLEPVLDELLADGCVAIDGAALRVPNFVTAQTALQSDKARKRAERERAHDLGEGSGDIEEPKRDVTPCDNGSRDVTGCRVGVTRGHAASRDVTNRETRGERTDKTEETLSPAAVASPTLPAQATVTTLALDLDEPTPPKPTKAKRAPKPPADPPPFSIGAAFEALAGAAGGRFAAGLDVDWTRGIRIAVAKSVRQYPDLAAWGLVGEWLAAGGDRFRGVLGPSWAASTALADAMARAREWDATGRPALAGAPANSGQTLSHGPDAWSAAAKRNGVAL